MSVGLDIVRIRNVIVIAALLLALLIASYFLPVATITRNIIAFIKDQGLLGVVLFIACYVVASVFMMPASLLTLAAGFLYGPLYGVLVASPASTLSAAIAFICGRYFFRGLVEQKLQNRRIAVIDDAISQQGAKIVFLLRLSPLFPFGVINYALAVTSISLRAFVLASFLGMLPGTVLYVYSGSLITSLLMLTTSTPKASGYENLFYWGGLVITVIVTFMVTRIAKNALKKALHDQKLP